LAKHVINPDLYARLGRAFGRVRVVNRGKEMKYDYVRDAVASRSGKSKPRLKMRPRKGYAGETYCVCCPFCKDTRFRCYVSYLFDTKDEQTGDYRHFLVHCWNEATACFSGIDDREVFYSLLDRSPRAAKLRKVLDDAPPFHTAPPGVLVSLKDLSKDHPAVRFLVEEKKFPLSIAVDEWGAMYCSKSKFRNARDRIYIPYVQGGVLQTWQMRYIGTPPDKVTPKYWFEPNAPRGNLVYNLDRAKELSKKLGIVVVEEGPTDAWRTGPIAVAVAGKSAAGPQLRLIADTFGDGIVFVLLDPAQDPKALARGDDHHIDVMVEELVREGVPRKHVVPVFLSDTSADPGSMAFLPLWKEINAAAKRRSIKLSREVVRYVQSRL
jgi:hypothetical protein